MPVLSLQVEFGVQSNPGLSGGSPFGLKRDGCAGTETTGCVSYIVSRKE